MAKCKDVQSGARWKRHHIVDGVCTKCLQPAFVKQKKAIAVVRPSKSFVLHLENLPQGSIVGEGFDVEALSSTTEIGGGYVGAEITRENIPVEFGGLAQ